MRFDDKSSNCAVTDTGRVASHYYIDHDTISMFNERLNPHMTEAEILAMVAESHEFENIMLREEEMQELGKLKEENCPIEVKGGIENKHGKVNILLPAVKVTKFTEARVNGGSNYDSLKVAKCLVI
eukprot:TRINITY_DN2580_c0_g1_i1.p1 TRINITY_DN2580_c0_g1~~TRINITY_DN2580_c0_g1_i1.p1  ORF type:complete len:139 (-),score=39.22 TRINITY_DN2580_c0_g1_i1:30-407(-)